MRLAAFGGSDLRRLLWAGAPVALVLLAFVLRLHLLEEKDIWWDEGWSVWLARHTPREIALRTASDEHPPLHYWLLHYWDRLVGEGRWAVRFSSVGFGTLAVALVYRLGRDFLGLWAALLSGGFLALARFHVWWSQEIKMYALVVFLALASVYALLHIFRQGGRRYWVLYLAATLAALYTSYLAALLLLAENLAVVVFLVWHRRRWGLALSWLGSQSLVGLFYLPWLYTYYRHAIAFERGEAFSLGKFLWLYATVMPLGVSTHLENHVLPAALVGLVAAAGVVVGWRRNREVALLVALQLLVLPVAVFLLSLPGRAIYHPKVAARYMVVFIPAYSLALAMAAAGGWRRWRPLGVAIVAALGLLMVSYMGDYYGSRHRTFHLEALARFLEAQASPEDALVLNNDQDWPVYAYHIRRPSSWYAIPSGAPMSYEGAGSWLEGLDQKHDAVWLITTPEGDQTDPAGNVARWLAERFAVVGAEEFGPARVTLFARSAGRDLLAVRTDTFQVERTVGLSIGGWELVGRDRLLASAWRGDVLYITTYWRAASKDAADVEVEAILLDEEGVLAARGTKATLRARASSTEGGLLQHRGRLLLPRGLPDGEYRVALRATRGGETSLLALHALRLDGGQAVSRGSPDNPASVNLGGVISFRGHSIERTRTPRGEELRVSLFWEALAEPRVDYTVFVHLVDGSGTIWKQDDAPAGGGEPPTSVWVVGRPVRDDHRIVFQSLEAPAAARLLVGMYDPRSGERLPVVDENGRGTGVDYVDLGWVELHR